MSLFQGGFDLKCDTPRGCVAFHPGWGEPHPGWQHLSGLEQGDLLSQDLVRSAIAQALAGCAVEAISDGLDLFVRQEHNVGIGGRKRRIRPLQFSTPPFCQGAEGRQK